MADLDVAAIEALMSDTFTRVRDDAGRLGSHGELGFDLQIVTGETKQAINGVTFVLRLVVYEGKSIRDIKEQEVCVVPGGVDESILPMYFEGIARGIQRLAATGDLETLMPHDLIPARALRDPACRAAAQFAALVGQPEPEVDLEDFEGTEPIARNADLERAVDDNPDSEDAYLIYADWLTQQGDPRGELISCSSSRASEAAARRAAELVGQHERYFAGPILSSDRMGEYVTATWKLGFFDELSIRADYELANEIPGFVVQALRGLMTLQSARFLRGLAIGCLDFEGNCNFAELYPILVDAGPRPSMQKLFLGDTNSEEQELSWTHAGELAELDGLYPNLRSLRIRAGSMALGALAYPRLETLTIETGGLARENVVVIAGASLPALRDLELWFGSESYGATSSLDDLTPVFAGDRLPRLSRLALRNCEYTDDICGAIVTAAVLPRLAELDLSMGTMTDAGAQRLLAHRGALAHLRRLDVSDNFLTAAGQQALAGLGIEVTAGSQKTPYGEDERYVTVGE